MVKSLLLHLELVVLNGSLSLVLVSNLLPRFHALTALEMVESSTSCARCGADATATTLSHTSELLEPLADVLLRHLEVDHVRLPSSTERTGPTALGKPQALSACVSSSQGACVVLLLLRLSILLCLRDGLFPRHRSA